MSGKLLAVLISGFAFLAAVGGSYYLADRPGASKGGEDAVSLYAQEIKSLNGRIARLEQELGEQSTTIATLRSELDVRLASAPRDSGSDPTTEAVVEAVKRDVLKPAGPPLVQANGEPTAMLERSVRDVIDRVHAEEKKAEADRDKQNREKRVKDRVDRLTPELGLDAYQASQVSAAFLETEEKLAALRGTFQRGGPPGPMDGTNPMLDIMNSRDEKLRLVLSSSQMEKLDELEPSRRWMRGMNNGGPGNNGGNNAGNGNGPQRGGRNRQRQQQSADGQQNG